MIEGLYKIFNHWHAEGSVWIISDTHFADLDLAANIHCRPTAENQVKIINSHAGKADTLIHLGDVGNVDYIRKLRAKRKILICGNHDAGRTNYERKVEKIFYSKDLFTENEALRDARNKYPGWKLTTTEGWETSLPKKYWVIECDNMLFDEVYEGPLMIAEKLILSHEPVNVPWAFNIHGHIHDAKCGNDKNHFNVCIDVNNYKPTNFNQWMKQGYLSKIDTIHRTTIDKATKRKKKRGGKKIGEK